MLVDVELKRPRGGLDLILGAVAGGIAGGPSTPDHLQQGIYRCGHWNFGDLIAQPAVREEWPEIEGIDDAIGVCDSPDQLLDVYGAILTETDRVFCVSLVKLERSNQPATGGWRWHKWGEYVGNQEPTMEYLHDEPKIEAVWTFHIYELEPSQ
jgi:hypothetical protein